MESMANGVVYVRNWLVIMCVSLCISIDVYNDNNMAKFCYVIFVTFSTFIFTIFLFERKKKKPFIRVEYVIP